MTALNGMIGYVVLALPFIAACLAPILTRFLRAHACWPLALAPALAFIVLLGSVPAVSDGQTILFGFDWIPAFDVRFSFRLDGLGLTFALLVTGIGTLIVFYSGGYLAGERDQGRFFSFILMFMGAMLGLVMADDFVTLFVYWELTSITSFLLIGFEHTREKARRGAIQALVITGGGGLALLAGLILLREATGLTSATQLLEAGDLVRQSAVYAPILILILCGAFTKSAQMPFHVWLPNAMEAPTPVSAYLHSATMVKAGVYLLLRLQPGLGDTAMWEIILPAFGGATLVVGALLSIRATDIKITLAYTTMASLGLITMMIGVGTKEAIGGAVLYLIAHSLFKGGLFMVAGSVDHGAGTRELSGLGGLARAMPVTFIAALLCALSMGGITPFVGFLAKEEIYTALEHADVYHLAILAAAILGNALMFAAAFIVALKPFVGRRPATIDHPHESPLTMLIGPAALGALGLAGALLYQDYYRFFAEPMTAAAAGQPAHFEAGWIPHLNLAFALSLATIALGIVLYAASTKVRAGVASILGAIGWGPDHGFDQAMRGLLRLAFRVTQFFQSGRLDYYMTVTVIAIMLALFVPMLMTGSLPAMPDLPQGRFSEWIVLAIILLGVVAVVIAKNRLTAVVSLGIQGFAVALLFMLLGAPDLSFTQFMVETLSVVILALVMTRLKLSPADHRPWRESLPDAALALGTGTGFGLFLLSVTQGNFDGALSTFFERFSYQIAHGHNIVNVIIVDFRGVDTMGEVAVVMTTGLAILALIRVRVGRKQKRDPDPTEATT